MIGIQKPLETKQLVRSFASRLCSAWTYTYKLNKKAQAIIKFPIGLQERLLPVSACSPAWISWTALWETLPPTSKRCRPRKQTPAVINHTFTVTLRCLEVYTTSCVNIHSEVFNSKWPYLPSAMGCAEPPGRPGIRRTHFSLPSATRVFIKERHAHLCVAIFKTQLIKVSSKSQLVLNAPTEYTPKSKRKNDNICTATIKYREFF